MSDDSTTYKLDDASPGSSNNPFDDPNITSPTPIDSALILNVDRNASLTIGAETLVIVDENLRHNRTRRNCFGLLSRWTKATQAIPFRNVLWAELDQLSVSIRYAEIRGGNCRVAHIQYSLPEKSSKHAEDWVQALMNHAYPPHVKRRKRIKVLINPFGGQGYAHAIWSKEVEPIFAAAGCVVSVEETKHQGHAAEIAEEIDVESFDVIAAASGDGLPHEIFNGLAKQKAPRKALRLAVTQIPCGSGNALSWNTLGTATPSWAAVEIVKGLAAPLDLVAITQGKRNFYSFLSQAVGIVAESDLGTDALRWMGPIRFQWGCLVRLFGKTIYPAEISIVTKSKDKDKIREMHKLGQTEERDSWTKRVTAEDNDELPPMKYGTIHDPLPAEFETADHPNLGNFYTGNMPIMTADTPFFPAALLQDGYADLITISGAIPRTTALHMVTTIDRGKIMEYPEVDYRKVYAYRITPRMAPQAEQGRQGYRWRFTQWLGGAAGQTEGLIAIDGEKIPFEPFQAEVHAGLGTIVSRCNKFSKVIEA